MFEPAASARMGVKIALAKAEVIVRRSGADER
jgi:hypothetical protein